MANQNVNSGNPKIDLKYRKKKSKEEMRYQIISFSMMLFLTFIAFGAVGVGFSTWFTVPLIVLLAVIQVIFQLYYFMHMSHKGHALPSLFLYGGLLIGLLTILAMVTIVWW
ncbi:cytochrome c oxidase subunit IVB [Bacillus sp. FJAT-27225]|uniref:cytochrome c oxidase subunit IVB n=1 Tax=Bacillus sp. FJAT-27225 TaxID=1743144 RepID=UPI00080C23FB|nr:cytochrome c oxidase subunit IVB [Bacillus sp. FJAT-27225]OCA85574.1 cytochrome c oxidase subunit IVB [Bacillus sp. FJAT-27225]